MVRCSIDQFPTQADTGAALDTALYFIRYINLRKKWLEQVNISRAECTAGGILPLATPDPTHASIVGDINPGCFLIAHPLLDDYFCRAVIFMLSHT